MTRSYKKVPIYGYAGDSDKKSKRKANRSFRTKNKQILRRFKNNILYLYDINFYKLREVSNVWEFEKDGKGYFNPNLAKISLNRFSYFIGEKTLEEKIKENLEVYRKIMSK